MDAEEVAVQVTAGVRIAQRAILAIPGRIASDIPYLDLQTIARIDDLIRTALTELAKTPPFEVAAEQAKVRRNAR